MSLLFSILTVCYFPDYNLSEEVTQQTINSTAYASGLYIDESSPSRCDGIASSLEVCAELRNDTAVPGVDRYQLFAYNFRDNGNRLYQQIGSRISLNFRGNTNSIICETGRLTQDNHEWTVQKGDSHFIAVEISSHCSINGKGEIICPAHAVLSPSPTMPDNTVGYTTEASDLIQINSLTATPGFVNAHAYIGENTMVVIYFNTLHMTPCSPNSIPITTLLYAGTTHTSLCEDSVVEYT